MTDCTLRVRRALAAPEDSHRPLEGIPGETLLNAHRESQVMGDMGTVMAVWREWGFRGDGQ